MHDADLEQQLDAALGARREPLAVVRRREAHQGLPVVTEEGRERLRRLAVEGFEAAGIAGPRVAVHLRADAGLKASVEQQVAGPIQRGERLTLSLSDGYLEAPDQAVRGLTASLGVRLLRRRNKPELAAMLEKFYDQWQHGREAKQLLVRLRQARARKEGRGPRGRHYDLAPLTARVVARLLGGRIPPVKVTWSSRASYGTLGHHDEDLGTIVISKALDHPDVPESVVAYVLYHELLHHVMGIQEGPDHRRRMHPPAFRRRERRFPRWALADQYLEATCSREKPVSRHDAKTTWLPLWDEPWDLPQDPTAPA